MGEAGERCPEGTGEKDFRLEAPWRPKALFCFKITFVASPLQAHYALPLLEAVEKELLAELREGPDSLLRDLCLYLSQGGGKRLRPFLLLLSGRLWDAPLERLLPLAVAVEFIHMATLVHDDVIDRAEIRRGRETVNRLHGDFVAVISGDYLFARAFSLIARAGHPRVTEVMAEAVNVMCQGEIDQHSSLFDLGRTEAHYYQTISRKTAHFIGEICRVGGMVAGCSPEEEAALRDYGWHLGMAFQIIDDLLDFTSSPANLGKPVLNDLRAGVYTLPLIRALSREEIRREVARFLEGGDGAREVSRLVAEGGGIRYARHRARLHGRRAREALGLLPFCRERELMEEMVSFVLERKF